MDFTGSPTKKRLIASFNIFDDGLGEEQKVSSQVPARRHCGAEY